ncbi:hypothetical protein GCM10028828_11820 [Corynebacterium tapiri]
MQANDVARGVEEELIASGVGHNGGFLRAGVERADAKANPQGSALASIPPLHILNRGGLAVDPEYVVTLRE